jgi:uncharacterized protein YukE
MMRNGASRFSQATSDFNQTSSRLERLKAEVLQGGNAWKGEGALSFSVRTERLQEDVKIASLAMGQIAGAINSLAGQLDQVNQLRQQAEQLQHQISSLQHRQYGAEEAERNAIHSEISHLSSRQYQLVHEADMIEQRANLTASSEFDEIGDMVQRLNVYQGDSSTDWGAVFVGPSKYVGHVGAAIDLKDGIKRYRKKFSVRKIKPNLSTTSGRRMSASEYYGRTYALVENGHADGIRGTRYYFSNSQQYSKVLKYIDPKTAVKVALTDVKAPGTFLGYLSVAMDTVDHLNTNIQEGRSASHIASEAIVDVGFGVGSMATAAWAGAMVGSVGGPIGMLAGAVVGVGAGYVCAWLTDGLQIDGKSVSTHAKEGLENLIDGGANLAKSGWDTVCSLF